MRPVILCIPLVLSVGLIPGCAPPGDSPDSMIAAAKAVDDKWAAAANAQDIDSLMACYWKSPDLLAYPSDAMQLQGWDEVRQSYAHMFESMPGAKAELIDVSYTVAGEYVLGRGLWKMSVPTGLGPVMDIEGRYTDVKAKRDGKWVIVMEHASVPMPPPQHEMETSM